MSTESPMLYLPFRNKYGPDFQGLRLGKKRERKIKLVADELRAGRDNNEGMRQRALYHYGLTGNEWMAALELSARGN